VGRHGTPEVRAGEVVGIAGAAGSGRAELARMISGALRRDTGTVAVDGALVDSTRDAARHGIVALREPSEPRSVLALTPGGDAVALPQLAKRRALLATAPGAAAIPRNGATTLAVRRRFLLANDPRRGLDTDDRRATYELIHCAARDGTAVVLASSDVREVLGMAHRVLVLRGGRVVEELECSSATDDALLRAVYGVSRA
jgi:ABC-type sugar transport system ATPase subunit